MERRILHCDMNNFYASVECMLDMSLRDKPVAICGSVEERHGIVLAKNYKAKAFGASTGEAVWQAQQQCRNLVVVPPHYEEYIKFSKLARNIYRRYTDLIQPFGMDECWLDVSGSGIYGNGNDIANEIRETVKFELGLTISVGVSFNKIFAKLGSDMKKPDAVTCIDKETFREKIWSLPASDLLGVGRATKATFDGYGILTIGDLANTPPSFLKGRFGKNGLLLHAYANGEDVSKVTPDDYECPIKSIGHGITTLRDLERNEDVWPVMLELSQEIGHKLRLNELCASGVAICVRDNELHFQQWQQQFSVATNSASFIAKAAFALFSKSYTFDRAQEIMKQRTMAHGDTPLNLSGQSLLVGNIFCAHCGNRLTLTTSGYHKREEDGSKYRKARARYQCHYNVRHPGECDGQSGYSVKIVDDLVEKAIRDVLAEIKTASQTSIVNSAHKKEIALSQLKKEQSRKSVEKAKSELADYQAEIIKVIRGESKIDEDILNELILQAKKALAEAEASFEIAKSELNELEQSAENLNAEYRELLSWADMFDKCSFDSKKMIVSQLIKSVRVGKDYAIEIDFNVTFEEYQRYFLQKSA